MSAPEDPFAVLGLDPATADEREAKRAYARLVKLHRPDRSPDEFRRVHAAFAAVRRLLVDRGGEDDPVDDAPPAPRDDAAPGDDAPEAAAPETDAPPYPQADALFVQLDAAFARGDVAAVRAALTEPAVEAAARIDPELAELCLGAVAGLAWRGEEARSLFWTFTQGPSAVALDEVVERVELDLRAAVAVRASGIELPAPLRRMFEDLAFADPRRGSGLRKNVDRYLVDHRDEVLAVLDRIAATDPALADTLSWWLAAYSPWGTPALSELPSGTLVALCNQLLSAGRMVRMPTGLPIFVVGGMNVALWCCALVLRATARWRYPRWGRARIARVIAHVGVPVECVRTWIRVTSRLVPRLRRFDPYLAVDGGLRLLGHLAWLVHPQQRLPGA